jgi:YgiT-type zinc finger domain-containing protein
LQAGLVTIPFVVGSRVVIVRDVPAEICAHCDESVMESSVAAAVDRLLKQAFQSGFEISIVSFTEPALTLA